MGQRMVIYNKDNQENRIFIEKYIKLNLREISQLALSRDAD